MLEGIGSVNCGVIAPQKERPRRPWVMDETLPKHRNPQEVMNEKMYERLVEKAKKKPDEDRNFMDYFLLAKDKLDELQKNSVIYMA